MPQIRRGFERSVNSRVIILRDRDGAFCITVHREISTAHIVAVAQRESSVIRLMDNDLPDAARQRSQAILGRISARRLRRCAAHLNDWPIIRATRSSTSRSSFVNAFSLSLSAVITPTTLSDWLTTGTTISERVLLNVGR